MSGINGDKARFNIRRKKKIHRRSQKRVMLGLPGTQRQEAWSARSRGKAEEKSA
jgi:hypothetical protein